MPKGVFLLSTTGKKTQPGQVHTPNLPWTAHRTAIAAVDSGGSNDAPGTVVDRTVAKMTDATDAAITAIILNDDTEINQLEIRPTFSANSITATIFIFVARKDDLDVRCIGSIALTAGGGVGTAGRFFTESMVITSYHNRAINKPAAAETDGQQTFDLDLMGYNRCWLLVDVLSAGNIGLEYSGL